MRFYTLLPALIATATLASAAAGQEPRIPRRGPGMVGLPGAPFDMLLRDDAPRAVIGVSTSSATSARDTLGVLVNSVRPGSPAEKAGIEEGNRIAAVNGLSLKLAAADVGDEEMAGSMARRLSRALDKVKPGDEVELRVVANSQVKTVRIKTISPDELYDARRARGDDRATLGVGLASTGSRRDSLGVFVMSVDDGGPAAKAGIEEGARIASINGVDVRGHRSGDEEDGFFRSSNVSRLEREMSRLKPGDDVELRVYAGGQTRTVRFKAGRAGDLARRHRSMMIMGNDDLMIPEPPAAAMPRMLLNGPGMDAHVRHALESGMAGMGRAFARIGGRVDW